MKKSKILEFLVICGLLAGSIAIYAIYLANPVKPVEAQTKSTYQTAPVNRGDIAYTASGSGTLVAKLSVNMGFVTSGNLATLTVAAGDKVSTGQVLATLDTIPSLTQAVANSQLALLTAQKTLDDLNNGSGAALAKALSDQAAAQAALVAAQNNLHDPHDWRCPDNVTAKYYQQYLDAMVSARPWQDLLSKASEFQKPYYQMNLKPILNKMAAAYQNYTYCQAYTPGEIAHSQADLQLAQANLEHTQLVYKNLQASSGIDPIQLAIDEAAVQNAQIRLSTAQNDLAGATLTAPFAGTISAVNFSVGQFVSQPSGLSVGTTPVLTIVSTDQPQILANFDETDLTDIGLGCQASAVFTPLAGKTFSGTVSQIYPSLISNRGTTSVQLWIDLKEGQLANTPLPIGTDATITVTCASSQNTLLVPVQAVFEAADGSAYVYVLNAKGQPEKRAVTLGIKTSISAEIKSGLTAGEQVITSPLNLP